ncbi:hypothetical protein [Nocardia aurantiaca]|uniref:Uncharacterized protein n=1 Tax=Nocardia aurantiaca TaxID=2675850 RepID=A0A6I3KVA9_9NOCA|nr:hypothetical protein [Nocardia aurantiaca]MTE13321.1 hypothetical protein [Nocardia aurantiaca]
MAAPTLTSDRWRIFLTWWRFWGVIGFCLSSFLSFLVISDLQGVPAFCGWRHPCPPQIILGLGAFPLYVWAAGGAISWQIARMAFRHGLRPALGIVLGALVFVSGMILSLYLVADYWWPNT